MHRSQTARVGRQWVTKFKEFVERELFDVVIQAAVGKHIIARETVKAVRKDVTAKLYGGDRTRRMKLLEKQKEGRKKLQGMSNLCLLECGWIVLDGRLTTRSNWTGDDRAEEFPGLPAEVADVARTRSIQPLQQLKPGS